MKNHETTRRIVAFLLVFVMIFGLFSGIGNAPNALAAEAEYQTEVSAESTTKPAVTLEPEESSEITVDPFTGDQLFIYNIHLSNNFSSPPPPGFTKMSTFREHILLAKMTRLGGRLPF